MECYEGPQLSGRRGLDGDTPGRDHDRLARNLQDRAEEEMEDPQLEGWRTGEHEENRGLVDFRMEIMRIHCRQG